MIKMIARALGKKRKVILLPNVLLRLTGLLLKTFFKLSGKQSGLDPYEYIKFQMKESFMDVEDSMKALAYAHVNMQESINERVAACGYSRQAHQLESSH